MSAARVIDLDERRRRYALAWERMVEDLANLSSGRRDALFAVACRGFELEAAGVLSPGYVRRACRDAMIANGWIAKHSGAAFDREVTSASKKIAGAARNVPPELTLTHPPRRAATPAPVGPAFPPRLDVAVLYAGAQSVEGEPRVVSHLGGRPRPGISVAGVVEHDLARVLPPCGVDGFELPTWCADWRVRGCRLVLPLHDHHGELRSLRARRVVGAGDRKELAPLGFTTAGLVLANPTALAMLRGEAKPKALVVTEGVPAHLAWASHHGDVACIGIAAGAWTADFARRVPRETVVILDTDCDETGLKYARQVAETFPGRPMYATERVCAWIREKRAIVSADEQPGGPRRASRRVAINLERCVR